MLNMLFPMPFKHIQPYLQQGLFRGGGNKMLNQLTWSLIGLNMELTMLSYNHI